ncbi:MAG: ABC transporter permease [Eubacteriaceae bacterium]|nr:ABC transporter permease [Eubacteriaceae bacterium]
MKIVLIGSIELGLVYAVLAMGVFVTFRVLNTPDLTVDGSFVLGMAVCALQVQKGRPFFALFAAFFAGALAGLATGSLYVKLNIQPILAGVLIAGGLYSVNIYVMGGRSNISLFGTSSIFTGSSKMAVLAIVCAVLACVLAVFFKTRMGMALRATGDNEEMVRASSINADSCKLVGFCLANGIAAMSGALLAQYQNSVDVGYGSGIVVAGLASVIIGEGILGRRGIPLSLLGAVTGSVFYRLILAAAFKVSFFPAYAVKLASSIIVAAAMGAPYVKQGFAKVAKRIKGKEGSDYA